MSRWGKMAAFRGPVILSVAIGSLALSDSAWGELFFTAYRNGSVGRMDERSGALGPSVAPATAYQQGFDDYVGLTVGPDQKLYVSSGYYDDSRFGRWGVFRFDPATGAYLGSLVNGGPLYHIAFGPDGDLYGVGSWSGDLDRYDGQTGAFLGKVLQAEEAGNIGVGNFAFLPDGNLFAATGSGNVAKYDLATGERIGPLTSLADLGLEGFRFDAMAVGPDGMAYAAYNYRFRDTVLDGGVMRFDGATGEYVDTVVTGIPAFGAASGGSLGLAFGPDCDLYVGSQHAHAILRYDVATGELVESLAIGGSVVGASYLAFSPVPEPGGMGLVALAAGIVVATRRSVRGRIFERRGFTVALQRV
jgi:WD40 repeat protein